VVCCLCAMGALIAFSFLRGRVAPVSTLSVSPTRPAHSATPLPAPYLTLTPLPGQWTETPTSAPGQSTKIPSLTPLQRTIAPAMPFRTPAPGAGFLETLTPEAEAHLRQAQLRFEVFRSAYQALNELHQQLAANPALTPDEIWKTKTGAALFRLEAAASQLAAVEFPDPNYAVYASFLDQLASETGFMAAAYRRGLDRDDPTSLQIAAVHLLTVNEILLKAEREYRAVKSRLATLALSPSPSVTLTP